MYLKNLFLLKNYFLLIVDYFRVQRDVPLFENGQYDEVVAGMNDLNIDSSNSSVD